MPQSGSKCSKARKSTGSKTSDDNDIVFKNINDDYTWGKCGDFKVIIMKSNGYINATKLCKTSKQATRSTTDFYCWKQNVSSKKIIEDTSKLIGISSEELFIYIYPGGNSIAKLIGGTYAHPMIITHIAYWLSPSFQIKVISWIEEWKNYSDENPIKYHNALPNMTIIKNNNKEAVVQQYLKKKLGGKIEAKTPAGNIDLLTNKYLIEIKTYDNWKCGIGQLQSYAPYYPDKQKVLYLFDVGKNTLSAVKIACEYSNIRLNV